MGDQECAEPAQISHPAAQTAIHHDRPLHQRHLGDTSLLGAYKRAEPEKVRSWLHKAPAVGMDNFTSILSPPKSLFFKHMLKRLPEGAAKSQDLRGLLRTLFPDFMCEQTRAGNASSMGGDECAEPVQNAQSATQNAIQRDKPRPRDSPNGTPEKASTKRLFSKIMIFSVITIMTMTTLLHQYRPLILG